MTVLLPLKALAALAPVSPEAEATITFLIFSLLMYSFLYARSQKLTLGIICQVLF